MAESVDSQMLAVFSGSKSDVRVANSPKSDGKSADSGEFSRVLDSQRDKPETTVNRRNGVSDSGKADESGNSLPSNRRDASATDVASSGSTGDSRDASATSEASEAASGVAANDSDGRGAPVMAEGDAEPNPSTSRSMMALAVAATTPATAALGNGSALANPDNGNSDALTNPMDSLSGARTGSAATTTPVVASPITAGLRAAGAALPADSAGDGAGDSAGDSKAVTGKAAATMTDPAQARRAGNAPSQLGAVEAGQPASDELADVEIMRAAKATEEAAQRLNQGNSAKQRLLGETAPAVSRNGVDATKLPTDAGVNAEVDEAEALRARTQRPVGEASAFRGSSDGLQAGRNGTAASRGVNTDMSTAVRNDGSAATRSFSEGLEQSLRSDSAVADTPEINSLTTARASDGSSVTLSSAQATTAQAMGGTAAANGASANSAPGTSMNGAAGLAMERAPDDPEFANEFTARVKLLVRDGVREARLQLHPAELGRLQVTLSTEGDQTRVSFIADTAAAKEAIEQSLPRLRDMLEQSGLQLAQSDVGQRGLEGERGGEHAERSNLVEAEAVTEGDMIADVASRSILDGSRIDTYI